MYISDNCIPKTVRWVYKNFVFIYLKLRRHTVITITVLL